MKNHSSYISVLFVLSFIPCNSQENIVSGGIQTPTSFTLLDETAGDLDNDGISEKVIVYDTEKETDMGTERQLYIYKKTNDQWTLWKKSVGAILPSQHGGMMGDPFAEISIERRCIVIHHFGGSRQKWNYTHRFRYQSGDFQLIGATVHFGSPCDYFFSFDYNLATGKVYYEEETEDCENENATTEKETITRKLEVLPTMNGFYPGNNEIQLPKSKTTVYY